MADDLNPQEYAKRLSGTRVDALVRAAVAALLDEYRAELSRDPAFILPAAEAMLRNADVHTAYLSSLGGKPPVTLMRNYDATDYEESVLLDAYAKLLAARKPAGEEGG